MRAPHGQISHMRPRHVANRCRNKYLRSQSGANKKACLSLRRVVATYDEKRRHKRPQASPCLRPKECWAQSLLINITPVLGTLLIATMARQLMAGKCALLPWFNEREINFMGVLLHLHLRRSSYERLKNVIDGSRLTEASHHVGRKAS